MSQPRTTANALLSLVPGLYQLGSGRFLVGALWFVLFTWAMSHRFWWVSGFLWVLSMSHSALLYERSKSESEERAEEAQPQ